MKYFCCLGFFLLWPFWILGEETSSSKSMDDSTEHGIWKDRPDVLKDYVRFMRDRTPYFEISHDARQRSNEETENLWQARLQLLYSSQLFYFVEAEHWSYQKDKQNASDNPNKGILTPEEESLVPVDPEGRKTTARLGLRRETDDAAEMEFWLVHHEPNTGAEGRYSDFWDPWHWELQGAYQIPWESTIVSRVLEGTIQRGVLVVNRIWQEGRWRFHSETTVSKYHLAPIPSFYTLEQVQEFVLTRSWFVGTNYGLGYSIERGIVQHPQPPVIVPDRLNHTLLGNIDHEFSSGFSTGLEITYQARLLSETTATTLRGETTYEPTDKQRYWLSFESGKSNQFVEEDSEETEIHWKAGIRFNW